MDYFYEGWPFYKWGDTIMHMNRNSYVPPTAEISITEIELIPTPDSIEPSSILQSGGRRRKRASFTGVALTYDDLASLEADYLSYTERIFKDTLDNTFTAVIEKFTPRRVGSYYTYDISLVEV